MGELVLISIGLSDERDITLRGLEEARSCDKLYVELYTTVLDTTLERLAYAIGKPIVQLVRSDLEEKAEKIIGEAGKAKVGLLVGGNCLAATTHVTLLLEAERRGVRTSVVHGSTILTAVAEAGLSLYHFGKTVTIPLSSGEEPARSPYLTLEENLERGLHTLFLLDLDTVRGRTLSLNDAMRLMLRVEAEEGRGVFTEETLVVGAARIGSKSATIRAGRVSKLLDVDFGPPPQVLIVPGKLHFVEEEALKVLSGCSEEDLKTRARFVEDLEWRTRKYAESSERVLHELRLVSLPRETDETTVREALGYAELYLKDAKYYLEVGKKTSSLASVCYCEGILDALRLLKLVEFEW